MRKTSYLNNPLLKQFAETMGTNDKQNRKQGKVFSNVDLAKMQWDYSQAVEEREYNEYLYNQYESPQAQMRQYQEAGLNPALMYGDATGGNVAYSNNAPTSTGIGNGTGEESGFNTLNGVLNMLMGAMSLSSQIEQQHSTSMFNKANARKANADAKLAEIDAETRGEKNVTDIALMSANADQIRSNIEKINTDIRNINADTLLTEAKTETEKAHRELTISQTDTEKVKQMLMDSQKRLADANANQINAMLPYMQAYYSAEVSLKDAQTDTERENAVKVHNEAAFKLLDSMKEQKLLENGYYDVLTEQLTANTRLQQRQRTNSTVELYLGSALKLLDIGVKGAVGFAKAN